MMSRLVITQNKDVEGRTGRKVRKKKSTSSGPQRSPKLVVVLLAAILATLLLVVGSLGAVGLYWANEKMAEHEARRRAADLFDQRETKRWEEENARRLKTVRLPPMEQKMIPLTSEQKGFRPTE